MSRTRETIRSLRLRQMHRHRVILCLPNCQLVKVSRRDEVTRVCRHRCLHQAGTRLHPDPHVRGIALSPEPEESTAPAPPCQGPSREEHRHSLRKTRIPPARSASRREQRTCALRFRNPTSIAHRHRYVKCWGQRVAALGLPWLVGAVVGNSGSLAPAKHYVKYVAVGRSRPGRSWRHSP